jgi:hypothetical protein
MGAKIEGSGTDTIQINGVRQLYGAEHTVIPDRIAAGTFMIAAAITNGDVTLQNAVADHLEPLIAKLREAGALVAKSSRGIRVKGVPKPKSIDLKTMPYPGFPTDLQPQMMALMTLAQGTSVISENIFENRFKHADELRRMGADIRVEGRAAIVKGVPKLTGAVVEASDLRAGAALVLAGMAADGITVVENIVHIILEAAGKKPGDIYAAGFDMSGNAVQAIRSGWLQLVIDQQQYLQGYIGVLQLCIAHTYGFSGLNIDTGAGFADKSNIEFLAPLVEKQIR